MYDHSYTQRKFSIQEIAVGYEVGSSVLAKVIGDILEDLSHYGVTLMIANKTIEEQFAAVIMVMERIRKSGMNISPEKTEL